MTSMAPAAVHHLLKVEGLFGGFRNASGVAEQHIRREDRAVKPVNHPAASYAADDSHIRAGYLRSYVGYKVFWQSIGIWRAVRLFLHSHCHNFPNRLPHEASGIVGTSAACRTLKFRVADNIRFRVASCSIFLQFWNRCAWLLFENRASSLAVREQFARFRAYGAAA